MKLRTKLIILMIVAFIYLLPFGLAWWQYSESWWVALKIKKTIVGLLWAGYGIWIFVGCSAGLAAVVACLVRRSDRRASNVIRSSIS